MPVFNANNKGFETKEYPLFFGEDMGLFDTVNIVYPQIDKLYDQQMSQIWNEFEVDLTQDRMDMQNLPAEVVDLMVKTIGWQTLGDSVASKSIAELLLPHATNSELRGMLTAQSMFEVIHARTYSHIIKQTFADPNQMLQDIYTNTHTLVRSEAITKAFDNLQRVTSNIEECDSMTIASALLRAFVALFALEGIAFMASFAVTFAITETDVFQGIGALVALICRDEVLHTRMDYTVLSILQEDPEWLEVIQANAGAMKEILDSVTKQELDWTDYLFSEGRQLVGLNANLLKEYVQFMALPIYEVLGVQFDFEKISDNPLPYMEKYVDPSQMHSAPQEINVTSYNIGAVENDTDSLDLQNLEF